MIREKKVCDDALSDLNLMGAYLSNVRIRDAKTIFFSYFQGKAISLNTRQVLKQ